MLLKKIFFHFDNYRTRANQSLRVIIFGGEGSKVSSIIDFTHSPDGNFQDEDELLASEPLSRPFTAIGIRPKTGKLTPQSPSASRPR